MNTFKPNSSVQTKTYPYDSFTGLDTSRDPIALDTGESQKLLTLKNAFCDQRGQIVRDPILTKLGGDFPIVHARHFGIEKVAWVERRGNGLALNSTNSHLEEEIYPANATVTSTVFNKRVLVGSRGLPTYSYDGTRWSRLQSQALDELRPAYMTSIQRRAVYAGIPGRETEVHFSRVDNADILPEDERSDDPNVLRAGRIDITNLLGTSDVVTGIGAFEQARLAIFTNDRAFIYLIDPNIDLWKLDDTANINVGCLSHNTISRAGNDIFFCSRDGVHTIKRSEQNGLVVFSVPMSEDIDLLYRKLVNDAPNKEEISAVFDQDEGQYHIFFPQPGGLLTTRLTLNVGMGERPNTWSTGEFINQRCGAFLGGHLVFGCSDGLYEVGNIEDKNGIQPQLDVVTPTLWLGSITDHKHTHSLLLQAFGNGDLTVEARDDKGNLVHSVTVEVSDSPDDNHFPDVPLSRQFELPFQHRLRGLQLRFTSTGKGLLRIIGFAITVKKS